MYKCHILPYILCYICIYLSHSFIVMLHSYIDMSQFLKRCCILKCRDNTLSYVDAIWSNNQTTHSYIKKTHSYIKMKHSYIKMIHSSWTFLSPPPPPPPTPGGLGCCDSVVVDSSFIVTPIVGVCICSMFCCTLLHIHSNFAFILMGKRELVAFLSLSSWCLLIVVWHFLVVQWICLQFVLWLWYFLNIFTFYFTYIFTS